MKTWLCLLLCLMVCLCSPAQTVTLNVPLGTYQVTPVTNRACKVQALNLPTVNSGSVIIADYGIMYSDTNGNLQVTNAIVPALFQITVLAPPAQTILQVLIPPGATGTINATNNLAASSVSTFPAGSVAWAAASSDLRYILATNTLPNGYIATSTNGGVAFLPGSLNVDSTALHTANNLSELTATSTTAQQNINIFTNLFAWLAGSQTFTGQKNFTGGLQLNGTNVNGSLFVPALWQIGGLSIVTNGNGTLFIATNGFPVVSNVLALPGLIAVTNPAGTVSVGTNGYPSVSNVLAGSGILITSNVNGGTFTISTNGSGGGGAGTATNLAGGNGIILSTNGSQVISINTNGFPTVTNGVAGAGIVIVQSAGNLTITTNGTPNLTNALAAQGILITTNAAGTDTFATNGAPTVSNVLAGAGMTITTNVGTYTLATNGGVSAAVSGYYALLAGNQTFTGSNVFSGGANLNAGARLGTIYSASGGTVGPTFLFDSDANSSDDQGVFLSGSPLTSGGALFGILKGTNANITPDGRGYYIWDTVAFAFDVPGFQAPAGDGAGWGLLVANPQEPIVISHAEATGDIPNIYTTGDITNGFMVEVPYYDQVSLHNQPLPYRYDSSGTNIYFAPQNEPKLFEVNQNKNAAGVTIYNADGSVSFTLANGVSMTDTNGQFLDTNGSFLRVPSYQTQGSGATNGYWDLNGPGVTGFRTEGSGQVDYYGSSFKAFFFTSTGIQMPFTNDNTLTLGASGQAWQQTWTHGLFLLNPATNEPLYVAGTTSGNAVTNITGGSDGQFLMHSNAATGSMAWAYGLLVKVADGLISTTNVWVDTIQTNGAPSITNVLAGSGVTITSNLATGTVTIAASAGSGTVVAVTNWGPLWLTHTMTTNAGSISDIAQPNTNGFVLQGGTITNLTNGTGYFTNANITTENVGSQTLSNTPVWNSQAADLFWAGPTSSTAAPVFRGLTNADFNSALAPTMSGANLTTINSGALTGLTAGGGIVITGASTTQTFKTNGWPTVTNVLAGPGLSIVTNGGTYTFSTNGAVLNGSLSNLTYVTNTIYTNNTGQSQIIDVPFTATVAQVAGWAGMSVYSPGNVTNSVSETTSGSVAPADTVVTNQLHVMVPNTYTYFFAANVSGSGNSAALLPNAQIMAPISVGSGNQALFNSAQNFSGGTTKYTFAHGLGRKPYNVRVLLHCATTDSTTGYTAGTDLEAGSLYVLGGSAFNSGAELTVSSDATNVYVSLLVAANSGTATVVVAGGGSANEPDLIDNFTLNVQAW